MFHPKCLRLARELADSLLDFDEAFRIQGAAPCQGSDAEGAGPLILCNVVYNPLLTHGMQGAGPCRPSAGTAGSALGELRTLLAITLKMLCMSDI